MLANILDGIMNAISMGSLLANLMGVTLGIIFGALPGLTAAMGVALLIPLTFGMPAVEAFSALLGMYVGAIYGGCITAILVGTPGTVSAAATMLEGPALTARGESRRALDMATIASFVGGIVSALALIFIAPMLARAAMSFGAPEYFAVAVFGLTVVASLSSGHLVKGLISALAGLFLATIGLDPVTGDMRNTFDNPNLFNGLSLVPVLVGLFAVSQVLVTVEDVVRGVSLKESTVSKRGISLKDLTGNVVNFIRSSVIGTLIGIIPATGVSAASFLAYSEAKRFSKTPEMYGKGCVEGIAATESSNNAVCGGALIPLLTLGVPGDIITAIMLGALMIQGLTPGPLLFVEHPVTVYGIFAAFIIANIMMLVCGLIAVRGAGKIIAIPGAVLMPIVITLCGQQLHLRPACRGHLRNGRLPDDQVRLSPAAAPARHDPRAHRRSQFPPGAYDFPERLQHLLYQPCGLHHSARQFARPPQARLRRLPRQSQGSGVILKRSLSYGTFSM